MTIAGLFNCPRSWVAVFLIVYFALLCTSKTSFEDEQHGITAINTCKALKRNGRCVVRYYQRAACKVTTLGSQQSSTREKNPRIRNNSEEHNKSKPKKNASNKNEIKARENSEAIRNDDVKLSCKQNCSEILQQFDKLRGKNVESQFKFPSEDVCAYLSIREKDEEEIESATTCRTRRLNASECVLVNSYLGRPRKTPPRRCPRRKTAKNICWFGKKFRGSIEDTAGLQCDTGICRDKEVHLGVFDITLGRITPGDDWRMFSNEHALVKAIGDVMQENHSNHFRFCLLRCALKNHPRSTTKQILIFPPTVNHCSNTTHAPRININIIVQDSISRHQFYRLLPKTVDTLREIVRDPSSNATVLDFEKYQSYDSSTHRNVEKLFARNRVGRNKTRFAVSHAIKELYMKFKNASYKTLFQEDACWFEGFASLLRPSFLKDDSKNATSNLWKDFFEYLKENFIEIVDSFGIGFSSCKLLQELGGTNIFNGEKHPWLCFDGRPFSHYYLNVVEDFLHVYRDSCPVFSYLHLNTGHEHTGQRITQDDEDLSRFVKTMATQHGTTLTILLSDHGGKTTEFATRTVEGLKEIYKPFMFLIVPRQAAKILGNERMGNLIKNQKRLVALEDLSCALDDVLGGLEQDKSLCGNRGKVAEVMRDHERSPRHFAENGFRREEPDFEKRKINGVGLFGEISLKRKCSELMLSADAVCLCEGEDVEAIFDELFLEFLASVAVGGLNNMIQDQYTSGKLDVAEDVGDLSNEYQGLGGYGNCLRYILKRVERSRSKVIGEERVITFNVVVNTVPEVGNREEIFEMTMGHHLTKTESIRLLKVTRLSRYSLFTSCADTNVNLDLCTCDTKSNPDPKNYIWELLGYYTFTRPSNIVKLQFPCLYLITTARERFLKSGRGRDSYLSHEIINSCDRVLNVTLLDTSLVRQPFTLSRELPFAVMIYPNSAQHVISAFCGLPDGEFLASFKVDAPV